MDPLTQGTLGAALPQTIAKRDQLGLALLCGALGGLAPDLDVLIRSNSDPLLFLEYHRQFSHSLAFIPLGAGLVALAIWLALGRRLAWRPWQVYLFSLLGYSTHALLDACTTYGTMLLWPFSSERFAWNNVSIIDPLLTVPLLVLVILSRWRRRRWPAMLGMTWVVAYLCLGLVLRDQAVAAGLELASSRGHRPDTLEAKPSFANLVLWKTVYRYNGYYYVDAVNVLGEALIYEGDTVAALDLERDFPWLNRESIQAEDVERFRWFSNGYLAADPEHPDRIIDLRYSLLPNAIEPLWSIELDREAPPSQHVRYLTHRERTPGMLAQFGAMLRRASVNE